MSAGGDNIVGSLWKHPEGQHSKTESFHGANFLKICGLGICYDNIWALKLKRRHYDDICVTSCTENSHFDHFCAVKKMSKWQFRFIAVPPMTTKMASWRFFIFRWVVQGWLKVIGLFFSFIFPWLRIYILGKYLIFGMRLNKMFHFQYILQLVIWHASFRSSDTKQWQTLWIRKSSFRCVTGNFSSAYHDL